MSKKEAKFKISYGSAKAKQNGKNLGNFYCTIFFTCFLAERGGLTIGNHVEKMPLCTKNADLNLALFEVSFTPLKLILLEFDSILVLG